MDRLISDTLIFGLTGERRVRSITQFLSPETRDEIIASDATLDAGKPLSREDCAPNKARGE